MKTNKIRHLYVHVPFCSSICYYCDFCHIAYREELVEKWLNQLEKEIKDKCSEGYETIYIGGGTPSCLSEVHFDRLLKLIQPYSENVIEYTIEINPESFNAEKAAMLASYGVNRASIGVQTSDDELLKKIGRKHSFDDVKCTIELLRQNGIFNISTDLMYSLPGQTMEILESTLNDILSLNIPHISIYSLTVEENSVFGKKGITSLDPETEADMYERITELLENKGFIRYEISNFSKEGYQSKHNIGYWDYDDFLGISAGASSKYDHKRIDNTRSVNMYIDDFDYGTEITNLSPEDEMFENVMMSLRMRDGLKLDLFEERYNVKATDVYREAIEKEKNNIEISERYLRVKNIAILNKTLLSFMD